MLQFLKTIRSEGDPSFRRRPRTGCQSSRTSPAGNRRDGGVGLCRSGLHRTLRRRGRSTAWHPTGGGQTLPRWMWSTIRPLSMSATFSRHGVRRSPM